MNILLINTSSSKIEFAYNKNGNFCILKTLNDDKNADDLVYNMKLEFEKSNEDFSKIQYVILSNGPGSFTGLRIGSAIAKGICFSLNAKLIQLSSLDILAEKYKEKAGGNVFTALIFSNSKTGEFYYADYISQDNKIKRISDYSFIKKEDLSAKKSIFIADDIVKDYEVINTSGLCNLKAMYALYQEGNFEVTDYKISEPYYMKKFLGY